jgi:hypothetical protein
MLRSYFYSIRGCESGGPTRVADDSGVNSMLQFRLDSGGDGMKRYRKIK